MTTDATPQPMTTAVELKARYQSLIVKDDPSFQAMEALYRGAKSAVKTIKDYYKKPKAEAKAKHDKLCRLEREHLSEFGIVINGAEAKLDAYTSEQKRIALKKRQEALEQAKKEAEDKRLEEAAELAEKGNKKEADALLDAPVVPEVIVPEEAVQERKGRRDNYYAEIVDIKVLFKHLGDENTQIKEFVEKDLEQLCSVLGLNQMARQLKGNMNVPGVKVRKK